MGYDELFDLYNAGNLDELVEKLIPWLEQWAWDVLQGTKQAGNYTWHEDLLGEGKPKLVSLLRRHIESGRMSSGEHLVNSLRLAIQKKMKQSRHRLHPVPIPSPETMCKRFKDNEPLYKSWELHRHVPLQRDLSPLFDEESTQREQQFDERLWASDPERAQRYWRFVRATSKMARIFAYRMGWVFVEVMYLQELNVSEISKRIGVPRSTVRDRLHRLGRIVAASAKPPLQALGEEFLGKIWTSAAKKGVAWDRTKPSNPPTDSPLVELAFAPQTSEDPQENWVALAERPVSKRRNVANEAGQPLTGAA